MAKVLAVNPNEVASIINVAVSNLGANPYRDMTTFPIQPKKVASLKESIERTGFWPSIIARPENNMVGGKQVTKEELTSMIESGFDLSEVVWEKAFAHHRQAACEALGFATIPIIPQILTDDDMLLMMALENKEGFGSNINSQLETVRQVGGSIDDMLDKYEDYEAYCVDYAKKDDRLFASKQSFNQAKEKGAGYRIVKKFLGETWTEADVKLPMEVLDNMNTGCFLQEDSVGVRSITLLHALTQLAIFIRFGQEARVGAEGKVITDEVAAPNWPDKIKDDLIMDLVQKCSPAENDDVKVTVAVLKSARDAVRKEGVNPVTYVVSRKGKTPLNVYEMLKTTYLTADLPLEDNLASIASLKLIDGIGNWSGLAEMIEKLKAAAERMAKGEADPEVIEGGELDATTEGDVDAAINAGESDVEAGTEEDSAFAGAPDTGPLPVNQAVQKTVEGCEAMSAYFDDLLGRISDVTLDEGSADVVQGMMNRMALFCMATMGKQALTIAFNAATKTVAVPE